MEAVAQPLNHRSADEDAAFEGIFQFLVQAADEGGDQPLLRQNELLADVLQQEAAGAVGVFCVARPDAQLPKESGLLISRDPCDLA